MDSGQIQFHIERKYLQCVLDLTKVGDISNETARLTAQVMQAMRPWQSWDEAVTKTEFLVRKFPLFAPLSEYTNSMKREQDTQRTIDAMHAHLKENNIDEALKIAQQH